MSITDLIPLQYRLLAAGLAMVTLMALSAYGAWQWQANAYTAQIATIQADQAQALAISMAAEQAKQLDFDNRVALLDAQHYQELQHARTITDALSADFAAQRKRLSVRISNPGCARVPANEIAAGMDDGAERADLHPETAARVVAVTGDADQCAVKLTGLQEWVKQGRK